MSNDEEVKIQKKLPLCVRQKKRKVSKYDELPIRIQAKHDGVYPKECVLVVESLKPDDRYITASQTCCNCEAPGYFFKQWIYPFGAKKDEREGFICGNCHVCDRCGRVWKNDQICNCKRTALYAKDAMTLEKIENQREEIKFYQDYIEEHWKKDGIKYRRKSE